jgi:hypothetical protein
MDLGNGLGHLTYSTLVHPGDTWADMWTSLTTYVPKVKARVAPNEPFGVSLRLSAKSAETLVNSRSERDKLKGFLADSDMYLYTVNAFPYGDFKGQRVKEQVYEPDWRTDERVRYTMNVADVLAEVAAPGVTPSIQRPSDSSRVSPDRTWSPNSPVRWCEWPRTWWRWNSGPARP